MRNHFSRSQRRKDRVRIKTKRQFHWGYGHTDEWACRMPEHAGEINYMPPAVAGMVINTPTPCSCWMCQNPRHAGTSMKECLTRQELKANDRYVEQFADWDDWRTANYQEDEFDWWAGDFDWTLDIQGTIQDDAMGWYLKFKYYKNGGRKHE